MPKAIHWADIPSTAVHSNAPSQRGNAWVNGNIPSSPPTHVTIVPTTSTPPQSTTQPPAQSDNPLTTMFSSGINGPVPNSPSTPNYSLEPTTSQTTKSSTPILWIVIILGIALVLFLKK